MSLQNMFGDLTLEETAKAMLLMLTQIADRLPRVDATDRGVVNVETGSIGITSGTITTVTTVSALSNVVNLGGQSIAFMPGNLSMPMYIYDNVKVS